jgi:uncharacterized protein involved in exopolysaccharide biosynthesis
MSQNPGEFIPIARLSSRAAFGAETEPPIQPEHIFHAIINLARRRRLFIANVVLAGTFLTGVAAFVVPPVYTATTQFMFEPTQAQTAAGMLEPVVDTHIATLTSDARLRDVLEALPHLPQYQAVAARARAEITNPTLEDRLRGGLAAAGQGLKNAVRPSPDPQDTAQPVIGVPSLDKMKNALLVRQERRSNVISVSYSDADPERASIIANQIVQMHVDRLTDRKRQQAQELRTWLDHRLAQAQAELEAADEALRAHVAAHGTPSADAAAGELTAETSRQLAVVRSELLRRQEKLARVREAQRSGAAPEKIDALLREPLVGTQSPRPAAPIATPESQAGESSATMTANPAALQAATELRLQRLEHEIDVFRLQEQSLAERIASLQAASDAILAQRRERQARERRAEMAAEVARDLLRQQQELKDPTSTGVQILAQASVPLRPSSVSPYLYMPAAIIAFMVLGGMAASVLERMDRSFRSERELAGTLKIGCIGLIPEPRGQRYGGRWRLPEHPSPPYDQAMEDVAAVALEIIRPRGDGKILAVTSSGPGEGKTALAVGIAAYAARFQRRVLLICADAPSQDVELIGSGCKTNLDGDVSAQRASLEIRRDPALGFDYLALDEIAAASTASLVGGELANSLDKLRDRYDYMIIAAPGVFESAGIRILAAKVDGVLFAVRWGGTRRDVAANAIELLMKPALLSGGARPNVFAVLTHVNLQAHLGYRRGDIGEFLGEGRRRGPRLPVS